MNDSLMLSSGRAQRAVPPIQSSAADGLERRLKNADLIKQPFSNAGTELPAIAFLLVLSLHVLVLLKSDAQFERPAFESLPEAVTVSLISTPMAEAKPSHRVLKPSRRRAVSSASKSLRDPQPLPGAALSRSGSLVAEASRAEPDVTASESARVSNSAESQDQANQSADSRSAANQPASFNSAYSNNPAPRYPALSRRLNEQGLVLLSVRVNANGEAAQVRVHRSSGFSRLDQAALQCVKAWRFVPARREGLAVSASVIVPIRFTLEG